jgi:hypothetical protein
METQNPAVPVPAAQTAPAVPADLSFDDLAREVASRGELPLGKFRVRVTGGEFRYTQDETSLGQTHLPKAGFILSDYVVVEVLEGGPDAAAAVGRKEKFYNGFKSGVSQNGFRWNQERDTYEFLTKHGITNAQLGTTEAKDAMGVRIAKDTYLPWFEYLWQYGGEYIIERKKNTKNPEKISEFIREYPVLFDENGNQVPKPVQAVPGASTPTPTPAPVQEAPAPTPAPVAAPVAEAPVPAPVAPTAVPTAVPTPAPVAEVPATPAAVPTAVPATPAAVPVAAPAQPAAVPTGLPTGLPGIPA